MRLIDADKMKIEVISQNPLIKVYAKEIEKWRDSQPTVKAIPIQWLHNIMKKQLIFAMESEMEGTTTVQDGVIHCVSGAVACQVLANVIELWEKENEKGNS